mmetsp:Transcript_13695/g.31579  ORF Transcript_13695/g.31579 Transcript_13695/m.31579 type:complete len:349 (+) Transcript_13695:768-1814(+)
MRLSLHLVRPVVCGRDLAVTGEMGCSDVVPLFLSFDAERLLLDSLHLPPPCLLLKLRAVLEQLLDLRLSFFEQLLSFFLLLPHGFQAPLGNALQFRLLCNLLLCFSSCHHLALRRLFRCSSPLLNLCPRLFSRVCSIRGTSQLNFALSQLLLPVVEPLDRLLQLPCQLLRRSLRLPPRLPRCHQLQLHPSQRLARLLRHLSLQIQFPLQLLGDLLRPFHLILRLLQLLQKLRQLLFRSTPQRALLHQLLLHFPPLLVRVLSLLLHLQPSKRRCCRRLLCQQAPGCLPPCILLRHPPRLPLSQALGLCQLPGLLLPPQLMLRLLQLPPQLRQRRLQLLDFRSEVRVGRR